METADNPLDRLFGLESDDDEEGPEHVAGSWTREHERLLTDLMQAAGDLASEHTENYVRCQRLLYGLTIPTIAIPLVCSIASTFDVGQAVSKLVSTAMIVSSIATALLSSWNPEKASLNHEDYAKRYTIFTQNISYLLTRARAARGSAELVVESFGSNFQRLRSSAPRLF